LIKEDINFKEVGDGNINFIFLIEEVESKKKLVIKQALNYVRCVGEEWQFDTNRLYFEMESLKFFYKYNP